MESASVLVSVAVAVANERNLVVVVEVSVGDGDPVGGVSDIAKTIVVVLAMVHVAGKVHVVDPNVGGCLDADSIASVCEDLGHGQVADNDVGDVLDVQADTLELGRRVDTKNGLVAGWTGLDVPGQSALDVDDSRSVGRYCFGESS